MTGRYDAVVATLESVVTHTDLGAHTLHLVVDGRRDARLRRWLHTFARQQRPRISVVADTSAHWHARSLNRALQLQPQQQPEPQRYPGDVVLLAAGALATPRWLDKLQAAAYARPNVASVAPFTNRASLSALPVMLADNAVPPGFTAQSFAAFIERTSLRAYPRLPGTVGPCRYLTQAALQDVGPFDESLSGAADVVVLDWLLRATQQGYTHTLDDASYIYQLPPPAEAQQPNVYAAYPEHLTALHEFRVTNPLQALHDYIAAGLRLAAGQ